nr:MAG TPA: hypothetical protein [Caudoviricetes sp.]
MFPTLAKRQGVLPSVLPLAVQLLDCPVLFTVQHPQNLKPASHFM